LAASRFVCDRHGISKFAPQLPAAVKRAVAWQIKTMQSGQIETGIANLIESLSDIISPEFGAMVNKNG
jgi:hypothetical protein